MPRSPIERRINLPLPIAAIAFSQSCWEDMKRMCAKSGNPADDDKEPLRDRGLPEPTGVGGKNANAKDSERGTPSCETNFS